LQILHSGSSTPRPVKALASQELQTFHREVVRVVGFIGQKFDKALTSFPLLFGSETYHHPQSARLCR
jgi:hypothetical protein